jgi:hypothetical protein
MMNIMDGRNWIFLIGCALLGVAVQFGIASALDAGDVIRPAGSTFVYTSTVVVAFMFLQASRPFSERWFWLRRSATFCAAIAASALTIIGLHALLAHALPFPLFVALATFAGCFVTAGITMHTTERDVRLTQRRRMTVLLIVSAVYAAVDTAFVLLFTVVRSH